MSLIRKTSSGGFLSPTTPLRHPIINLLMRIIVPLMPLALEYFEDYIRRARAKQKFEAEAARPMTKPLSINEALDVLAIDPKHVQGANQIPFPQNSEARKVAEKNFKRFFAMCQPQIAERNRDFFFSVSPSGETSHQQSTTAEGKSTEKKQSFTYNSKNAQNAIPPIPRNDYLAGKFSGAYRVLVDPDWDRVLDLSTPNAQNNNNDNDSHQNNTNQNNSA